MEGEGLILFRGSHYSAGLKGWNDKWRNKINVALQLSEHVILLCLDTQLYVHNTSIILWCLESRLLVKNSCITDSQLETY